MKEDELEIKGKIYQRQVKFDNGFIFAAIVCATILLIALWCNHIPLLVLSSIAFGMQLTSYGFSAKFSYHEK